MKRELNLPDWGPYSRHYMGLSRLLAAGRWRQMMDFIPVPGYMRGRVVIADVNYDCGYHPWTTTPDYSYYSVRYDLRGMEDEYCHAEFFGDARGRLLKLTFHNNTAFDREYTATCFAVQRLVCPAEIKPGGGDAWLGGADYLALEYQPPDKILRAGENYETFCHLNYLNMGFDGLRRGVTVQDNLVGFTGLGNRLSPSGAIGKTVDGSRTFLMNEGTRVTWRGDGKYHRRAYLRFSMAGIDKIAFSLTTGGHALRFELSGGAYADSEDKPALYRVEIPDGAPCTELELCVLGVSGGENKAFLIDGWLLTDADDAEVNERFTPPAENPRFTVHRPDGEKGVALTSAFMPGMTAAMYSPDERPLPPPPYSDCAVTNVYSGELSGVRVMRKLCNDSLLNWGSHNCQIYGDMKNHFAGYHAAPIICRAGESRSVYIALICDEHGLTPEEAITAAKALYERRKSIERRGGDALADWLGAQKRRVADNPYGFGQERLMCNLFGNVTYPVYIKDGFYRTLTPGKRWGGLYTWDSGMLGIGLSEYSPELAERILSQYFTDADDPDIDAVLHGTQLPLHIYLLFQLYQKSGDKGLLRRHYLGAYKYYRYFAGMSPMSVYDKFKSGLLCPFEDGYNAEGIDDYPPQHYAGLIGAYDKISPACTSAHAVRTGKLLALMAEEIGMNGDAADILKWCGYLERALLDYSWDEAGGYFSYVWNETKKPLYYDADGGVNFNMGIDGVSPLLAGIVDEGQLSRLLAHLMTPGEMWTPFGITSVDMSAPYARRDGYWNGKVWIPHQWLFYKALITEGEPEAALKIARTALEVWERSVSDTYNCYEQFCSVTGMGEGCHNFGGLSAPVASFYFDLYEKGRVTAGFDSVVRNIKSDGDAVSFILHTPRRDKRTSVMVCVGEPGLFRVRVGDEIFTAESNRETLTIPLTRAKGSLEIEINRV